MHVRCFVELHFIQNHSKIKLSEFPIPSHFVQSSRASVPVKSKMCFTFWQLNFCTEI